MGTTEWTIIATAIALFVALGSLIRVSSTGAKNELKGDLANVRSELKGDIADLRAELKGDIGDLRAELKGDMADLRAELKGDMADLRAELKGDMADLRTELKLDFQANRAEIITNRRMLGRFALHRHGEDGLPLAPLTDTLEPPEGSGDPTVGENGDN